MDIQLMDGEKVIKEGLANHFKGLESVGGKLYLTNFRLFFKSHSFNIQNHEESYYLDNVMLARPANTVGIIPNGLIVKLKDGREEKFVVNGRSEWAEKILYAQSSTTQKSTTRSLGNSKTQSPTQIIINGNVSGSNIIIGNENEASTSLKEGNNQ